MLMLVVRVPRGAGKEERLRIGRVAKRAKLLRRSTSGASFSPGRWPFFWKSREPVSAVPQWVRTTP